MTPPQTNNGPHNTAAEVTSDNESITEEFGWDVFNGTTAVGLLPHELLDLAQQLDIERLMNSADFL
jgi:hypothetical protein